MLLTTHYMEEADRLCSPLAIIDNGQIVVEGEPAG
jgi:ABC-2 type transport system ATP-binding protein